MKRRFIVIVLDGFGMGATKDAYIKRPGDEKACRRRETGASV